MATIDADANVHRNRMHPGYIEAAKAEFCPVRMSPGQGRQVFWFIGGRMFSRGGNVNTDIAAASCEIKDIKQ